MKICHCSTKSFVCKDVCKAILATLAVSTTATRSGITALTEPNMNFVLFNILKNSTKISSIEF